MRRRSALVYEIFGAAPGFGVVMAQAVLNSDARDRAVELLLQGESAPDVLAAITAPDFDFLSALRQYAVIDARGTTTGFTGDATMAYADDVQGRFGELVYAVQGNTLTGAAVIDQARAVFEAPGCDLADTLMRALEAGALGGEGDSRCTPDGIPADGAFLRVDRKAGLASAPWLELRVDDTSPESPLVQLRALYDTWRIENPCRAPEPPDAGAAEDASTLAPAADASTPPEAGSMAPVPVAPIAGSGGASGGAGGAPAVGSGGAEAIAGNTAAPAASDPERARGGCSATPHAKSSRASASLFALVLATAFARARRVRTASAARARGTRSSLP